MSSTAPTPSGPDRPLSRPLLHRPGFWLGAWWLWFIGLTVLSSIPSQHLIQVPLLNADKFEHMGFFLLGSTLWGLWLRAKGHTTLRWWWLPLVALIVGAIDEYHQTYTPNRSGNDPGDLIADVLGGFLARPVVGMICRRWHLGRS